MFRKIEPPRDPEEILTGICATCKTTVASPRHRTTPPPESYSAKMNRVGTFNDLPTVECPMCKARVLMFIPPK